MFNVVVNQQLMFSW